MTTNLIETLVELMQLPAPTGQEEPVLGWCRERWASAGATVESNRIANVLARFPGNGPKLLIQGHADEIGFVVKSIDERGFVWLADGQAGRRNVGQRYPVGQSALVIGRKARVPGLFATATGHVLSTKPAETRSPLENDIFVDLGVSSREEAIDLGVHVGAGVLWNPPARRLGDRIYGKAIDDRVALALMTHLIEELSRVDLAYDLTLAATVQEEIGLVGATSLGHGTSYDLAIAIDNGPTADYPGVDSREIPIEIGKGPALVYKDAMTHYDRRVIERLRQVAATASLPIQECIFPGFGSDGGALIRGGIPTALLAIPSRYTHSPFEMLDEQDLDGALTLLKSFVTTSAEPLPLGSS